MKTTPISRSVLRKRCRTLSRELRRDQMQNEANSASSHGFMVGENSEHPFYQSQRIVSSSPGLRGTSYPGSGAGERPNPNGVASYASRRRHNPVGVDADSTTVSQGSSCLATLGFEPESRWDSIPAQVTR